MTITESIAFSNDDPELERQYPLVPEGQYQLRLMEYRTAVMFGKALKVVLIFEILDPGEHFQKRVAAFYNAGRLIGRPGRNGGFKVGITSRLARDVVRLCGKSRLDRLPLSRLKNHLIVGRIKTITKGADQREIPEDLRYSIVTELMSIEQ